MTDPVLSPEYWLLFGLPWPDNDPEFGEAAIAVAPPIIPRGTLAGDSLDILSVADAYVKAHTTKIRVVFFSDLTLWLDSHGGTWGDRGTDWEAGKDELLASDGPALYITVSHLAHIILCDASRQGTTVHYPDHTEQITPAQRQDLRTAITNRLSADWPAYINGLLSRGQLHRIENS